MMAPKQQLEKNAWEWARTTSPDCVSKQHVETVYRLHLKPCDRAACKKNCSGSPHCLNALGEKRWLTDDDHDVPHFDPDWLKRGETGLIGLENLGATCYINTFLQVWFHNRQFRTAVLLWQDPNDEGFNVQDYAMECDPSAISVVQPIPASPCRNLQLVFSQLAFSQRSSFAPEEFIRSLEIDTSDQQDAQEFSKLFMALLEKDTAMCRVIQQQFMGKYEYITRCSGCHTEVSREDSFYELLLNIHGHKELSDSLKEFFQEQVLNGDNQYHCERCACKNDATRSIRLQSLPAVLNIQLARFVFENGRKKKLSSYISFPEVLDMSQYLHPTQGDVAPVYDLFAVLIHRGQSASSGHYIAVIKDPVTGNTYNFNDTEVKKEKKFNLANEEEGDGAKSKEKPRAVKGCQTSHCAYMLVYRLQSLSTDVSLPEVSREALPARVQEFLRLDDEKLELEIQEETAKEMKSRDEYHARKNDVTDLYSTMLAVHNSCYYETCEWITSKWLSKWMSETDDDKVPQIDNRKLCCRHNRLDPWSVSQAKLISTDIADKLFDKFKGGVRLACRESMCRDCVASGCFAAYHKALIDKLSEDVANMAVEPSSRGIRLENHFWVTKMSLRKWSSLAKRSFERKARCHGISVVEDGNAEADDPAKTSAAATSDSDSVKVADATESASELNNHDTRVSSHQSELTVSDSNASVSIDDEDDRVLFNGDIVCSEHGGLRTDVLIRCALISAENWRRLTEQLAADEFVEVPATEDVCLQCEFSNIAERNLVEARKKMASDQRNQLADLYQGRNRPSPSSRCIYLVSAEFVKNWKAYVRDSAKCSPVNSINNSRLLCLHGKLCAELPSSKSGYFQTLFMHFWGDNNSTSDDVVYVRDDEWRMMQQMFTVDVELRREVITDASGKDNVVYVPEMCDECYAQKLENEGLALMVYDNATIYISKVDEVDRTIAHAIESVSSTVTGSNSSSSAINNSSQISEDCLTVVDDQITESASKRKLDDSSDDVETKIQKLGMASAGTSDGPPLRRSTRVRNSKNSSKEFTVSSSMTLHELKMKIARVYEVLKTDQHLFFNGEELLNEDATLQALGIPQGAHLLLKIDELPDDQSMDIGAVEDGIANRVTAEKGFKGTLLSASY